MDAYDQTWRKGATIRSVNWIQAYPNIPMPRRLRIALITIAALALLAGAWYFGAVWTQRNPITVRVLGYERTAANIITVKIELENTSPFPVMLVGWGPFLWEGASQLEETHYFYGDDWQGRYFPAGAKLTDDFPYKIQMPTPALTRAALAEPMVFLYGWEPMPAHTLRKWLPGLRKNISRGSMPFRMGRDGPFTFEKADVEP